MREFTGLCLCFLVALLSPPFATFVPAQRLGDLNTAGFGSGRTYLNSDAGDFRPPLKLTRTVSLAGEEGEAQVLADFEERLLVGFALGPVRYLLLDAQSGEKLWSLSLEGSREELIYQPAFSGDRVILGGTIGVTMVEVSTGQVLWSDTSVGETSGRFPLLVDDTALYHGAEKVVAARAGDGAEIWSLDIGTAQAPLSLFGNRLYFLDLSGALHAVDVRTGEKLWVAASVGGEGSNIVATEKGVFVNQNLEDGQGVLRALDASSGEVEWESQSEFVFSNSSGLLQAYKLLFTLEGQNDETRLRTRDPMSGQMVWEVVEAKVAIPIELPFPPGQVLQFGQVANNAISFFNRVSGRIRIRAAFTGVLLWSLPDSHGLRQMVVTGEGLVLLTSDEIAHYQPIDELYFPQIGDGQGQSTLLALSSLSSKPVTGRVEFFSSEGTPLAVAVGGAEAASTTPFEIAPGASVSLQTSGIGKLKTGWARVRSSGPVSGSAIFQFSQEGEVRSEGGVGQARAAGRLILFARREGAFNTGIALANPNDEDARVTLKLGKGEDQLQSEPVLIPAHDHSARFVDQIFKLEPGQAFEGSVLIESPILVAATAIRTQNGLQISSVPAAVAQR